MSLQKLSGPGKFRWTEESRLALNLLKTEFDFDGDDETAVFTKVFGTTDISKGKLSSQYSEKIRLGKEHQWQFLNEDSPTARKNRQMMRERITGVAHELGLEELGGIRLGRLSLSTPKRAKRSRSSPELSALSNSLTDDIDGSRAKRRRAVPDTTAGFSKDAPKEISSTMTEEDVTEDLPSRTHHQSKQKTPRTPRKQIATIRYDRPSGPVMLTAQEIEKTEGDPEWPEIEPPRPALVFRYWVPCTGACGPSCIETTGHFVARRFRNTFGMLRRCQPPSKEQQQSFWDDAFNHLNRNHQDSPFVSVSTSLAWTLREAIKKAQTGSQDVKLSLCAINDDMALYYAPLFQRELAKKYLFTKRAWRYKATSEYLVHYSCKPFFTTSVSEIMQWAAANSLAGEALRLNELSAAATYHNALMAFKRQNIDFSPALARFFAEIATTLFAFTPQTSAALFAALVATLVEGWALIPKKRKTREEWADIAANFAHAVCRKSLSAVDFKTQEMLKAAFLSGVKFGIPDRTATDKPIRFEQMEKRSNAAGLSSPAQILSHQYDAAKIDLWTYEKRQNQIIRFGKRSALLTEMEVEMNDDGADEHILYDTDDDEDVV